MPPWVSTFHFWTACISPYKREGKIPEGFRSFWRHKSIHKTTLFLILSKYAEVAVSAAAIYEHQCRRTKQGCDAFPIDSAKGQIRTCFQLAVVIGPK